MNFKKTAISLAVASVAAAPIVASADGSVYASTRIGIAITDEGQDTEATIQSFGSRFGIRGETDLGNGLTAWGRYEFEALTDASRDNTSQDAAFRRRHAVVGLKGDFGNVFLGQTSHTFYNFIVVGADYPWWGSGYNMLRYQIRTDNTISYQGDFGPVSIGASLSLQPDGQGPAGVGADGVDGIGADLDGNIDSGGDSENVDEYELAIAFDAGPVRIGLGVAGEEGNNDGASGAAVNDEPLYGIAVAFDAGPVALAGNYQTQEQGVNDATSLTLNAAVANFYAHVELLDDDAGTEPTYITLGYTHNIGPRTLMYFEVSDFDRDTGDSDDDTTIGRAVLKYDIL